MFITSVTSSSNLITFCDQKCMDRKEISCEEHQRSQPKGNYASQDSSKTPKMYLKVKRQLDGGYYSPRNLKTAIAQ